MRGTISRTIKTVKICNRPRPNALILLLYNQNTGDERGMQQDKRIILINMVHNELQYYKRFQQILPIHFAIT